ncbi:MAG: imidazolonepropionase [Calditrichaceae bacterium]|nr:imidazolonepropionase [Calditrichaceae bacterium]MBN2709153.1 imidazolonepropionase [Calditrichaceae bacterium]RQV96109.1 MAG: imidazolonepropionase [Calditrichota bacterium]
MRLLIKNIAHIYSANTAEKFGSILDKENAQIIIEDGLIKDIQNNSENINSNDYDRIVDARSGVVLPGFVDAHTHPVFWHTREDEFIMRIQGKSYEEIAEAGGGIRNSVRKFRQADYDSIKLVTKSRIARFAEYGTTTIEAKSGYGLSLVDEMRSLQIINEINAEQPIEMVPTFLGAHEIPDEYRNQREAYLDLLINEMIPAVKEKELAKYCDVFCEQGVFTVDESRRILKAANAYGLKSRIHADELSSFGGAELAGEIKAVSADHLVKISEQGIRALAENNVIPILLPGTTFFLGKNDYAPARKLIQAGCEIALATDFNPGSSATQNMQLIWTISAIKLGLLPQEILWATTIIPARSLGLAERIGSIEPGKQADLIILDIPNLNYLPYFYGMNHVSKTLKKGEIIYERA